MGKVKKVKAWAVLRNDGKIRTWVQTSSQYEIYTSSKEAHYPWRQEVIVPCTITYTVPERGKK